MKNLVPAAFLLAAIPAAVEAAPQGSAGDPGAGHAYARQVCAECHAVEKGEKQSPHAQAPSFTQVANAKDMNPSRLRVWFQISHRSMPDLALGEKQSDDLIAYITSLKRK